MFFTLYKVLFSGFLQFNGNFVDGQSSSKYRDWAPLIKREAWAWRMVSRNFGIVLKKLSLTSMAVVNVLAPKIRNLNFGGNANRT